MATGSRWRAPLVRTGKRLAGWLVALFLVGLAVSVVYVGTPYEADTADIAAVAADDRIDLDRTNGGYVISPAETDPVAGLVFYPGGRVAPNAYISSLAPLTREANVMVVIPAMPLNLAVVDYGAATVGLRTHAADSAMATHETIDEWYVGGHSLGGAMACRYTRSNDATVSGLLQYGAYCDRDVSDRDLSVLSVVGTADTVLNWDAYDRHLDHLPQTASVESIDGINHTQFGSYTSQDEPSGTNYDDAHAWLNEIAVPWLQNETGQGR